MEEMLNYLDQKILDLKCHIDYVSKYSKEFNNGEIEGKLANKELKRAEEEREILCKILRFISVRNDRYKHENMFND